MNQNLTIKLYGDVVNTSSIFSANTNTNVIGILNVKSGNVSLTYSINDYKNFGGINSAFSRVFSVVGDDNVNQIFRNIFSISSTYSSYNINRKVKARVFEGGTEIMDGYLQITSIANKNQNITYECVIYGENDNLLKNIGDVYLRDLPLDDSIHTYTASTIVDSWTYDNTLPYYYPLLFNGQDYDYNDINGTSGKLKILDFRPATNLNYLLNKIFNYAGKTFTSSILNSQRWRNVIIPFYGSQLEFEPDDIKNREAIVGLTTGYSALTSGNGSTDYVIPYDLDIVDTGNRFDTSTNDYTADAYYIIDTFFTGKITVARYPPAATFVYMYVRDAVSGVALTPLTYVSAVNTNNYFTDLPLGGISLAQGQKVEVVVRVISVTVPPPAGLAAFSIDSNYVVGGNNVVSKFKFVSRPQIVAGNQLSLATALPKNVKAVDLLKSIAAAANLFIEPNPNIDNDYIVESRNDYYLSGSTLDWSSKLDSSKEVISTMPTEFLAKQIYFTYKKDSDYYNEDYSSRSEQDIFGQKIIDIDNDFIGRSDKKKNELIFAPTPITAVFGTNEIVVPKLGKQDDNLNWKPADSVIRLLQKPIEGKLWMTGSSINFEGTSYKYYPYAGMLDKPFNDETFDLSFDKARFYYYGRTGDTITVNNLYNLYWSNYVDEISSPDARIVTAYFNLTSTDISNFRFWDKVYFKYNGNGNLFYVNKIINYVPGTNKSVKVELVKVLNIPQSTKNVKTTGRYSNPNISTAGNDIQSRTVINAGSNNRTGSFANNNEFIGNDNYIDNGSRFNFISGSANTIYGNSQRNSIIGGASNVLPPDSVGNTIIGSSGSSLFYGVTGSTIIGLNNFTGMSSNTVYLPSLTILSGLTIQGGINGINLEQYWKSGSTGFHSLLRNHSSGNTASNSFGLTTGGSGNTNTGKWSSIINGRNHTISDFNFQSILNGVNNSSSAHYTTILNGKNNIASGDGATIFGTYSTASGFYSFCVGSSNKSLGILSTAIGKNNWAKGNYSFVQGASCTANTTANFCQGYNNITNGTITGGQRNTGLGTESFVGQGRYNTITDSNAYSATIVNGRFQTNNGFFSTILNGSGNTIFSSVQFGSIINGRFNTISGSTSRWSSILVGSGNTISSIASSITSGVNQTNDLDFTSLAFNLKHSGGLYHNYRNVTSSYTATTTDYLITVSGTSASTIYLPASPIDGMELVFKDVAGNATTFNVTINGNGKNIDGSSTFPLNTNFESISLIYCNNSWSTV